MSGTRRQTQLKFETGRRNLSSSSESKPLEENKVMGSLLEEGFRYGDQGQGSVIRMGYMGKESALSHQGVLNAQNTG